MFENCSNNGFLFSCFKNFGRENATEYEQVCNRNYLKTFGISDFYNFHEQLNQTKIFSKARDELIVFMRSYSHDYAYNTHNIPI